MSGAKPQVRPRPLRPNSTRANGPPPQPPSRSPPKSQSTVPVRPPRIAPPKGPQRASRASSAKRKGHGITIIMDKPIIEHSVSYSEDSTEETPTKSNFQRQACLARSIICLDQNSFMEQMRAEEEMEKRMSMVRKNVPLPLTPSVPPPSTFSSLPSPRKNIFSLKLHHCKERIENFISQEIEFAMKFECLVGNLLHPVRERHILSSFEIVLLFSTVETVLKISKDIVTEMKQIISSELPLDTQEEEIFAQLAQIFINHSTSNSFSEYITYTSNLPSVSERINTFRSDHTQFDALVKNFEKSSDSLLQTLHLPKQRMTAYRSFVSFLLENVPNEKNCCQITYWGNGMKPTLYSLPESEKIRSICCGKSFVAALTEKMDVWSFGESNSGALGLGKNITKTNSPNRLPEFNNISDISCGPETLAAISLEGKLLISGSLPDGNQNLKGIEYNWSYKGKLQSIHFAGSFCIAVTEHQWTEVWSWGNASHGQLGLGNIKTVSEPTIIEDISGIEVSCISVSEKNAIALLSDGKVFIWGSNTNNATGCQENEPIISNPTLCTLFQNHDILTVSCGNEFFFANADSGDFFCWGNLNSPGILGNSLDDPVSELKSIQAVNVQCGSDFALCLCESGAVYSWGDGTKNQTGQENTSPINHPKEIFDLSLVDNIQISCSASAAASIHAETPKNSFSSRISRAKSLMDENISIMEEQIRKVENISQLLEIELSLINGKDFNIVIPTRSFIMKAIMRIGGMDGQSFMFDDSILLCWKRGKRFEIYQMILFESCIIGKQFENGTKAGFEIREAHKVNKFVPLEFSHKNERDLWHAHIKQQIEQFGTVQEDTNKNRPPSYFPPIAPATSRAPTRPILQKTISFSNVEDFQANFKAKTKNFKISKFSNRTFQKFEKKVVALTEGPMLTTEGASSPILQADGRSTLPNISGIPPRNQQNPPAIPGKPTIPRKPRLQDMRTTSVPVFQKYPNNVVPQVSPKSQFQKPIIFPEKLSDSEILDKIRLILDISPNANVVEEIAALKQELDHLQQ